MLDTQNAKSIVRKVLSKNKLGTMSLSGTCTAGNPFLSRPVVTRLLTVLDHARVIHCGEVSQCRPVALKTRIYEFISRTLLDGQSYYSEPVMQVKGFLLIQWYTVITGN